jgi:hypothetical protein
MAPAKFVAGRLGRDLAGRALDFYKISERNFIPARVFSSPFFRAHSDVKNSGVFATDRHKKIPHIAIAAQRAMLSQSCRIVGA